MTQPTTVAIEGSRFLINGRPTYEGTRLEGLLMNSRMVQGVFDDLNPQTRPMWDYPDGPWDPRRNTDAFLAAMPTWREHGLVAFTINFQGGSPQGYSQEQPWRNSAYEADGSLRSDYAERMARVLDRADELGMAVILGFFYFGQDHRLDDEAAVMRAADEATDWLLDRGDRHVLIEIANECDICYTHPILKAPRAHELIRRVQQRSDGRLLVSTSYSGGTRLTPNVARVADFVLLHGNGVPDPDGIRALVRESRAVEGYRGQPVVINEDDHFDFDRDDNHMLAAVDSGAGWGFFDYRMDGEGFEDGYQSMPADWGVRSERKRSFFKSLQALSL